jgi:hypothetical protein
VLIVLQVALHSNSNKRLVGCWQPIEPSGDEGNAVEIRFLDDGQLRYGLFENNKWQIMKLTYRIESGILVTDQPSAPREERTRFAFDDDGALVLESKGEKSKYRRGECRAPAV